MDNQTAFLLAKIDNALNRGTPAMKKDREGVEAQRRGKNAELPQFWPRRRRDGDLYPDQVSRTNPDTSEAYGISRKSEHQGMYSPAYDEIILGQSSNDVRSLSHEAFHFWKGKDDSLRSYPRPESGDVMTYQGILDNIKKSPNPWAGNVRATPEETIAEIYAREANLPLGTSYASTEEGKQILDTQDKRDYYYHNISKMASPDGGIWEGQIPPKKRTLMDHFRGR